MNKISRFFVFLYNKIIGEDIDTVKYMIKQTKEGKPILDPEKKAIFIREMKAAPVGLFKDSWYWVLAIIFCFAMGSLVGFEYCEIKCNNFIIEEYGGVNSILPSNLTGNFSYTLELPEITPDAPIFPCDIGEKKGNG